jgi:predicted RNase H-like nuclease (RuvC/YqgF family)
MVKGKSLLREILCGLLLGLLIMPPAPVRAQLFGGIVFDPKNYTLQIAKKIDEASQFLQTVTYYQQLYTNAVNQLTTLRGVLQTVERELSKNMEIARLTNDIAEIIRGSYQLRRQVENMVRYQIASLQRIDDRLKNGILDPERDLQDFEEYLVYSMGRNSRQTIQLAVRAAQADAQLSKWVTQKTYLEIALAEESKKLKAYQERLDREKNNLDPSLIQALNESIQKTEARIDMLKKNIAELEEKIQQRINALGLKLSDMENFGYTIESTKAAWRELKNAKSEISSTFDATILEMKTSP